MLTFDYRIYSIGCQMVLYWPCFHKHLERIFCRNGSIDVTPPAQIKTRL
jgi:hypothetical protein